MIGVPASTAGPRPEEPPLTGPAQPDPTEHDLELTTSALKAGAADLGIRGALIEIVRWQDRLDGTGAPVLVEIGAMLAELRGELESDAPAEGVIKDLMGRLGERTLAIAADVPDGPLRTHLRELGNQLVTESHVGL